MMYCYLSVRCSVCAHADGNVYRQPPTLSVPIARTNLLQYAPIPSAIELISFISKHVDTVAG